MNYCLNCAAELLAMDADPNGREACVCLQCRAEEDHDFDAEPRARFTRFGEQKPRKRLVYRKPLTASA